MEVDEVVDPDKVGVIEMTVGILEDAFRENNPTDDEEYEGDDDENEDDNDGDGRDEDGCGSEDDCDNGDEDDCWSEDDGDNEGEDDCGSEDDCDNEVEDDCGSKNDGEEVASITEIEILKTFRKTNNVTFHININPSLKVWFWSVEICVSKNKRNLQVPINFHFVEIQ